MLIILSADVTLVASPTVFNAELCNSSFNINSTQWHMESVVVLTDVKILGAL